MRRLRHSTLLAGPIVGLLSCFQACSRGSEDDAGGAGDGDEPHRPVTRDGDATSGPGFWEMGGAGGQSSGEPNEYSWDGSWSPDPESFPLDGLVDETHGDLPPGKWGWDGSCDCPGDEGLAIYDSEFVDKGLDFQRLEDSSGALFGWRLVATNDEPMDLNHRGDHFDGTVGVDIFDLKLDGKVQGTGGIHLGDGPDMLRYGIGWSVNLWVGDSNSGATHDNDLVILGTDSVLPSGEYDIYGTTIHTGPGSDLVFARNFGPAALDLGNGNHGRTDALDPQDGPDMAVLAGNMRDFRVFGGAGNDVFVWYVDEVLDDRFLGPSFYGGGGWGDALWAPTGTDRLIMIIDPATQVVSERSQHDDNPGSFLAFVYDDYSASVDGPTEDDVFARYYGTAPIGPSGEHTVTVSYRSPDGAVFTHDFYITSVEEIQFGLGHEALVYDVDSVTGQLSESAAPALESVPTRAYYNDLFETFGR